MLQAITIHNFALIDNISLQFEPGLNVLTGETGAGKSIIIDALTVALGGRASADYLRAGANSARVEAAFSLPSAHPALLALQAQGITEEENDVILVREINSSGRNVCRINGHLVTTAQLKEIAQLLVDVHGQHAHQTLLNPATHLNHLDALGGEDHLLLVQKVAVLYRRYSELTKAVQELEQSARERAQRIDMLNFQINEIDAAALDPSEWEELQEEKKMLTQREKLLANVGTAYALLYGSGKEKGVLDLLGQVQAALAEAQGIDKRLTPMVKEVESTLYSLEEVVPALRRYQESFPLDPGRLEMVEERLQLIRNLSRKYGQTIEEILSFRDQAACALEEIQNAEQTSENLKEELAKVATELSQWGARLSSERQKLAANLEEQLAAELSDLGMPKARIKINFSVEEAEDGRPCQGRRVQPGPSGFDHVEFLLAANPGEPPRPLAKIASGGELSRVMLALKTILAAHDSVPTLIFDEVDSGIGGKAAAAVAAKLAQVSRFHQVICVTHLPQIAAMGDTHFQIRKETDQCKTYTLVEKLAQSGRQEELGRMLAGRELSPIVLKHAEEMLDRAQRFKEKIATSL